MSPPGYSRLAYYSGSTPRGSRQRHRAARGRRDPRHKGGPGTGEPSGCLPGAKLHGLIRGRRRPSPPRGARRGPGLTGAQKGGRREAWTDRRREWRAQETRRAAEALPRPRYVTMRPGGRRRSPGPPTGARGRVTRSGGAQSPGTQPPPTDGDRPPVSRPGPRPSPAAAFPAVPGRRTCCLCLPRAFTSAALALPPASLLSSPPTFGPLLPLSPPPPFWLRCPPPPPPPSASPLSFFIGNEISPHRDP